MIYYQIYITENLINGKTYIGQHKTNSLKDDDYIGSGLNLWRAIKKYGIENFIKNIIEVCNTKDEANFLEKRYIKFFRSGEKAEYNIADGGMGGGVRGRKYTEEAKKKISEALRGIKRTDEYRKKMSEAQKGKQCGNKNPMFGKGYLRRGEKNPMFNSNRRWIHNGILSRRIPENEVQNYINNGWLIGKSTKVGK